MVAFHPNSVCGAPLHAASQLPAHNHPRSQRTTPMMSHTRTRWNLKNLKRSNSRDWLGPEHNRRLLFSKISSLNPSQTGHTRLSMSCNFRQNQLGLWHLSNGSQHQLRQVLFIVLQLQRKVMLRPSRKSSAHLRQHLVFTSMPRAPRRSLVLNLFKRSRHGPYSPQSARISSGGSLVGLCLLATRDSHTWQRSAMTEQSVLKLFGRLDRHQDGVLPKGEDLGYFRPCSWQREHVKEGIHYFHRSFATISGMEFACSFL